MSLYFCLFLYLFADFPSFPVCCFSPSSLQTQMPNRQAVKDFACLLHHFLSNLHCLLLPPHREEPSFVLSPLNAARKAEKELWEENKNDGQR